MAANERDNKKLYDQLLASLQRPSAASVGLVLKLKKVSNVLHNFINF